MICIHLSNIMTAQDLCENFHIWNHKELRYRFWKGPLAFLKPGTKLFGKILLEKMTRLVESRSQKHTKGKKPGKYVAKISIFLSTLPCFMIYVQHLVQARTSVETNCDFSFRPVLLNLFSLALRRLFRHF